MVELSFLFLIINQIWEMFEPLLKISTQVSYNGTKHCFVNKSSQCWMQLYKISWKCLIEAFNGCKPQTSGTFFTNCGHCKQNLHAGRQWNLSLEESGGVGHGVAWSSVYEFLFWDSYLNLGISWHTGRIFKWSCYVYLDKLMMWAGMEPCAEGPGLGVYSIYVWWNIKRIVNRDDVFDIFCHEKICIETRYTEWRQKAGFVTTLLLESLHISMPKC